MPKVFTSRLELLPHDQSPQTDVVALNGRLRRRAHRPRSGPTPSYRTHRWAYPFCCSSDPPCVGSIGGLSSGCLSYRGWCLAAARLPVAGDGVTSAGLSMVGGRRLPRWRDR